MNQIKIGADIELGVKPPNSSKCLPVPFYTYGKKDRRFPRSFAIGRDHNGKVLEIRPKAASTPTILTNNIKSLLKQLQITGVRLISAPYVFLQNDYNGWYNQDGCPTGGHIHLSWKNTKLNFEGDTEYVCNCQDCRRLRTRVFPKDILKFNPMITLNSLHILASLIEDKSLARKRRNDGYGGKADLKIVTGQHIEFRRMPSFIYNPFTTRAVLAIAYAVCSYEIDLHINNSSLLLETRKRVKQAAQEKDDSKQKNYIRDLLETIPWFNKNRGDAQAVKYLLNRKLPLPSNRNILTNWGLTK